jgi:TP901 family phage tail tape measure protein
VATVVADMVARATFDDQASAGINQLGQTVDGVGTKSQGMSQKAVAGFGLMGAAAGAAFGGIVGAAAGFEQGMANVNSIIQVSDTELAGLSDQVLALSGPTLQAPKELADAMYDVVSAGFSGAEALEVVEQGAIAGSAGMTTAAVGTDALTSALGAYGLGAEEAGRVSDTLFQIVNQGKLTFPDLANNMSNVLPVAAALSVGLDEVGAAYASLTLQGSSAATAETGIAAILRAAISPTEALTGAVEELGFTSVEAFLAAQPEGERFGALLNLLETASGGTTEGLRELLGTGEATTAALALLNDGTAGYTNQIDLMAAALEKGGITEAAFAKQTNTLQAALKSVKNAITVAAVELGTNLLPALTSAADFILGLVNSFGDLDPRLQSFIAFAIAGAAALAGIGAAAAIAIPVISALGVVLGALLSPFGLIIAAIAAFAIAYKTNFLGFGDLVDGVVSRVVGILDTLGTQIDDMVTRFRAFVTGGVNPVAAAFYAMAGALDILPDPIQNVLLLIGQLARFLERVGETQHVANAAFERLPAVLQPAAAAIGTIADAFFDLARAFQEGGLSAALDALPGELAQIGTALLDLGGIIASALAGLVVDLASWTLNVAAPTLGGWILSAATWVGEQILAALPGAGSALANLASWTLNVGIPTLAGWVDTAATWLQTELGNVISTGSIAPNLSEWWVNVGRPALLGWAENAAENIKTDIQAKLTPGPTIQDALNPWSVEVAEPEVKGAEQTDVIGWIDDKLEGVAGVDVELQTWNLTFANPEMDLTVADITEWIDAEL